MISPLAVYRARRMWRVGWFIAWTRLRARRAYWQSADQPRSVYLPLVDASTDVHPRQ